MHYICIYKVLVASAFLTSVQYLFHLIILLAIISNLWKRRFLSGWRTAPEWDGTVVVGRCGNLDVSSCDLGGSA